MATANFVHFFTLFLRCFEVRRALGHLDLLTANDAKSAESRSGPGMVFATQHGSDT
jgi:hypothetical protein